MGVVGASCSEVDVDDSFLEVTKEIEFLVNLSLLALNHQIADTSIYS